MCGITGLYQFGKSDLDLSGLHNATKELNQRGPDYSGTWNNINVGLGHTRLSIIDTSSRGNQPMIWENWVMVYNGEVYNYRQIRKELLSKGHTFESETDSEVVLKSFIQWGPEALSKLDGFFALAIYDQEKDELFLGRDRYGIKPLLYKHTDEFFCFASELKSLTQYQWLRELDIESLNLYFQLTYIPPPKSIFKGVFKLEPGYSATISKKGVSKERYYQLDYNAGDCATDFTKAKLSVKSTLEKSVLDRLVSDVSLGSFLSGGIDSTIISGVASREVKNFNTFSIGYADNKYFDETKYAEIAAKKFGTHHHTFKLTNDDLLENVTGVVDYLDEPFADSSALPVHILSQKTKKHVKVALSGDGADEVFSGYNKHAAWIQSGTPDWKTNLLELFSPLAKRLPQSRDSITGNLARQIVKFSTIANLTFKDRYWALASFGSLEFRSELLKKDYFQGKSNFEKVSIPKLELDLNQVLKTDLKIVLPGDMLPKVDLMSMSNGLEVRVPFLAESVVNAAFKIPQRFKIKGSTRKYVLREAFEDLLPSEILNRGKHGFEVPLLPWFRNELSGELDNLVFNRDMLNLQGIFNAEYVMGLKEKIRSSSPGDSATFVWQLYVFQRWWKKYMA